MPQSHVVTRINGAWVALLAVVLVTVLLWAAKAILLPLALGVLLAFALTPLVRAFDRLRLPRFLGVLLTMSMALGAVGGVGYVLVDQFADLSEQVTKYTSSMRQKVAELRIGDNAALRQFTRTVDRVTEQLDANVSELRLAQPVRVVPPRLTPTERLHEAMATIFQPVASAVIVLVLVAFMLGQREDLRDRLIRLTGTDNVTLTTRLMDEAALRVSRFLVAQTLINICLGVLVAAGLYWIGVPYAALWGGLAAVLRFVPYVGTMLSALLPACLAFAVFPGWTETLQTLAMFLVLDVVTGYFIEPLLFGRRTGVSSFALLVSALFWIWVWGPVGLILSTPLTVCIAVLGRHIRSLRFLAILFAEEPALMAHVRYYQRLLARDEDEANVLVARKLAELGSVAVLDEVLIPALALADQHRSRNEITPEDYEFILESTAEIVGQLRARLKVSPQGQAQILIVGPRVPVDRVVLDMLATVLEEKGHPVTVIGIEHNTEQTIAKAVADRSELTCVVAISATRGAEARNYCRRIRAARPGAKLLVLRPLPQASDVSRSVARMKEAGADRVAVNLGQAMREAEQLLEDAQRHPSDRERASSRQELSERLSEV